MYSPIYAYRSIDNNNNNNNNNDNNNNDDNNVIHRLFTDLKMNIKKLLYPMYILLVYKKELSKNDYLKTLLITIIKKLQKDD